MQLILVIAEAMGSKIKVAFLILACILVVFCKENPVTGTCSNAVVVMRNEERDSIPDCRCFH